MVLLSMLNTYGEGSTVFLKIEDLEIITSAISYYSQDLARLGCEFKSNEAYDLGERIINFKNRTIYEFGGAF